VYYSQELEAMVTLSHRQLKARSLSTIHTFENVQTEYSLRI